jgi:hypothetical protein
VAEVTGSGGSLGGAFRAAIKSVSLGKARASYTAVSPRAQFRKLASTAAGRRSLEQAGVGGNARTRGAWLAGARSPSKANAAAIGQAYSAMRQGGIPSWVRNGKMEITGDVAHGGTDRRPRGSQGYAPLRVNLSGGNGPPVNSHDYPDPSIWDAIERAIEEEDDDYLDELIGEELIPADDDVGGYDWGFPGGSYGVVILG